MPLAILDFYQYDFKFAIQPELDTCWSSKRASIAPQPKFFSEGNMNTMSYRIESSHPIVGPLTSGINKTVLYIKDRAMAVVLAAKSETRPYGKEIRVVHQATGEVIYRKTAANIDPSPEL
jgi:hypothetical protein